MRASPPSDHRLRGPSAFTLVELIIVMVLLTIAASLVIPHMASFMRGRVLSSEARRLLALTHYAQSRAVADGVPVLLWVDPKQSCFGLSIQPGSGDPDDRSLRFQTDPTVTIEAFAPDPLPSSEDADERLGAPNSLPAIRFMPDGFYDEASAARIVIRQGTEGALEVVQQADGLGYEIEPAPAN